MSTNTQQDSDIDQEKLQGAINQISAELERFQSQNQYLSNQFSLISTLYQELLASLESLKEIETKNAGEKVLIPLGSRLFLNVALTEETRSEILVNLGSGIYKKSNNTTAVEALNTYIAQTKSTLEKLQDEITRIEQEIARREDLLNQIYAQ